MNRLANIQWNQHGTPIKQNIKQRKWKTTNARPVSSRIVQRNCLHKVKTIFSGILPVLPPEMRSSFMYHADSNGNRVRCWCVPAVKVCRAALARAECQACVQLRPNENCNGISFIVKMRRVFIWGDTGDLRCNAKCRRGVWKMWGAKPTGKNKQKVCTKHLPNPWECHLLILHLHWHTFWNDDRHIEYNLWVNICDPDEHERNSSDPAMFGVVIFSAKQCLESSRQRSYRNSLASRYI